MPTIKPTGRRRGAQPSHSRANGQGGPPRLRRGGQPGNVNALRSGRRSKRLRKLIVALMGDPEVRSIVLALATAQEEPDVRWFDRILFLHRVAKLKQEMRRYGALVDKRTRANRRREEASSS